MGDGHAVDYSSNSHLARMEGVQEARLYFLKLNDSESRDKPGSVFLADQENRGIVDPADYLVLKSGYETVRFLEAFHKGMEVVKTRGEEMACEGRGFMVDRVAIFDGDTFREQVRDYNKARENYAGKVRRVKREHAPAIEKLEAEMEDIIGRVKAMWGGQLEGLQSKMSKEIERITLPRYETIEQLLQDEDNQRNQAYLD